MKKQTSPLRADWVRHAKAVDGVARIEARFHGTAYAMDRLDTYAIGCTMAGG